MRVIWKDSNKPKEYKPIRYRGYMIWGTPNGWEITVPGDNNMYTTHYCAQNAIDQYFGDYGQHGTEKRKGYGIQIVEKKAAKHREKAGQETQVDDPGEAEVDERDRAPERSAQEGI